MDIRDIEAQDLSIISISADDNILYIEYCGGYEYNYYNQLEINLTNKTYTSNIKDLNKQELAKVLNKIYLKYNFDANNYRKFSIMELWKAIKWGVDKICRIEPYNTLYQNIQSYINTIGEVQINNLAIEYNNIQESIIDKLIEHYYLLYLQYSYQIFNPSTLSIENTTDYNTIIDQFYINIIKAKNSNNTAEIITDYDPDEFILEKPTSDLLIQYMLFAQSFVFQFTQDLKRNFFE